MLIFSSTSTQCQVHASSTIFCLPRLIHVELSLAREVNQSYHRIFRLRIGREQHVLDSSNHSPCLIKLLNSRHMTQRHTQTRTHTHHTHTAYRSKTREERKMKEKSGQSRRGHHHESHGYSCRLPALVLNFSPL